MVRQQLVEKVGLTVNLEVKFVLLGKFELSEHSARRQKTHS